MEDYSRNGIFGSVPDAFRSGSALHSRVCLREVESSLLSNAESNFLSAAALLESTALPQFPFRFRRFLNSTGDGCFHREPFAEQNLRASLAQVEFRGG